LNYEAGNLKASEEYAAQIAGINPYFFVESSARYKAFKNCMKNLVFNAANVNACSNFL
jgi:hypothetical protein